MSFEAFEEDEGYQAYFDSKQLEDCPYSNYEGITWKMGWERARDNG